MKNRTTRIRDRKEEVISIKVNKGLLYIKPVYARKGDIIIWKALDSDITLFFPDPNLFGETLGTILKGKHKKLQVQIGSRSKQGQKYYYSVYHHGLKDFGVSNSSPAIIIKT
jgi:hypothetical protein